MRYDYKMRLLIFALIGFILSFIVCTLAYTLPMVYSSHISGLMFLVCPPSFWLMINEFVHSWYDHMIIAAFIVLANTILYVIYGVIILGILRLAKHQDNQS
jgi:hypothetical protein